MKGAKLGVVDAVAAGVLRSVGEKRAVRPDARRDQRSKAALVPLGVVPERIAGLDGEAHRPPQHLDGILVGQAAAKKAGEARLVRRRDDAVGPGREELPVDVADGLRCLHQDRRRPQLVVEVVTASLEGRGQATVQHQNPLALQVVRERILELV